MGKGNGEGKMSKEYGLAALNLEMTDRVPRTEYSAAEHWELVKAVTGIEIDPVNATQDQKLDASRAFMEKWNYDMLWTVRIKAEQLGPWHTSMGHAVYAAAGTDFNDQISSPFEDEDDVLSFRPFEQLPPVDKKEAVKLFEENIELSERRCPDALHMTGTYISLMSGLIDMFGWNLLLTAAGCEPELFGKVTNSYARWIGQYFEALAEADVPCVMVHDDIVWTEGAFLHPDWYRKYIFPNYKKMIAPVLESGKKVLYTSDGGYSEFIDDIADCGFHGFVMEPMTDMKYIAEKYGKTHVFVGNADTRILLTGSKEDIYNEVKRCMDIGKNCPGFFMAVGNHIPSNTPVENALYYNEVYEKLSKR